MDADLEDEWYYDDCDEPCCHTCHGEGWVDSVVEETNRYGWDRDETGQCPNCGGSGKAEDCWYW